MSWEDGWWYILLPTERKEGELNSGIYLGKLSEENWGLADALFEQAPTVDDRKHTAELYTGRSYSDDKDTNGPYDWGSGKDFTPDLSRWGEWETDLRAVVTLQRGALMRETMEVAGECGGVRVLHITSEFATFVLDEWDSDSPNPSDYGETITRIYEAVASDNTVELSSWFRIIKDGQAIPGTACFDNFGVFTFTFDQPLGLPYVGAQVIVEIGPEYGLQS